MRQVSTITVKVSYLCFKQVNVFCLSQAQERMKTQQNELIRMKIENEGKKLEIRRLELENENLRLKMNAQNSVGEN